MIPNSVFDFSIAGLTVTFDNQSTGADGYAWDFGDGSGSNAVSPVHTYANSGIYTVTLNAQQGSCGRAASRQVSVGSTSLEELARAGIRVYPNPVTDRVRVEGFTGGSLYLYSSDGRLVRQQMNLDEEAFLPRERLPAGIYWLRLVRDREVYGVPLVLR
jgi:hypothetical protein